MNDTTKQAAPLLAPPYRVIAGRGIVDARGRLVASIIARAIVLEHDVVRRDVHDELPHHGLTIPESDALAHELVRVLNSHTRIVDALRDLVTYVSAGDDRPMATMLEEGKAALEGTPPTLDGYTALMDVRYLLTDIRDFWAGGDCPPELWALIEAATGAPQRAADAVLKAGMEDDGNA